MVDQITKSDIKGDLLQRLECATCTRKLGQVEDFEVVQLNKKESNDPKSKRATTIQCSECIKLKVVPIRGYRYAIGGAINEFRIEDLPDFAESKDVSEEEEEEEDTNETTTRRTRRSR